MRVAVGDADTSVMRWREAEFLFSSHLMKIKLSRMKQRLMSEHKRP